MTVDLSRVIALAHKPEVTLDHVRSTSLTFLARRHSPGVRYRIADSFASRPGSGQLNVLQVVGSKGGQWMCRRAADTSLR
jgi:hypothetical protein